MDKRDASVGAVGPVAYAGHVSAAKQSEQGSQSDGSPGRRLAGNLALYTLARLALVVVLAAVIMGGAWLVGVQVPLIVAVLFAIVIAMPVSLALFKGLRGRVNADIAAVDERRRRDKAALQARLRGEAEPEAPQPADQSSGNGAGHAE